MTLDSSSAGATPAAGGATPSQSAPAAGPAADPATGDDAALGDAGKRALDAMKAERKAAEDRARASDARAKAAEAELETIRTANLSEEQKRQKRLADLEREQADWQRERQEWLVERAVQAHASRLGFVDPSDAVALLDRSSLEFETDGTPRNVEQQLSALAKAKPHLLGRSRTPGSFDTGTAGGQSAASRTYTRAQLKDTKFYQDNQADILVALREGRVTN